jgi:hypothetical protein
MSNVQIQISNSVKSNPRVEVRSTLGKYIKTLAPGEQLSVMVVAESDIQIRYDGSSSPMMVEIDYVDDSIPASPSTTSVALGVYSNSAVYIEAKSALSLVLTGYEIYQPQLAASTRGAGEPSEVQGVKCGEIII